MKKFYLFVAALFAAVTINAKEIVVDLSTASEIAYAGCTATPSLSEGIVTINYSAGSWQWSGVEFSLDNLAEITSVSFDYKGDGSSVVIYAYLRDSEGNRWCKGDYYLNLSSTGWTTESAYVPDGALWDAPAYAIGDHPFTKFGVIANPGAETIGVFELRNVVITVPDDATAFSNVQAEQKAQKVVRNGQIFIIRDGRTFNALGAEVK